MTDKSQEATNYRFSGYQLPLEQFDETGPAYAVIRDVHPYFKNQPLYWSKPAYGGVPSNQGIVAGEDIRMDSSGNIANIEGSQGATGVQYHLLPIDFI